MENNPNTGNNPNSQVPPPPVQPGTETKSFMKKWADKLPGWMFPKLNPKSAHTCAIVGLVLASFSMLLAIIPCVGGNAWFFGIPSLYVCLMAIRASSPSENKNGTLTTVGVVLAVLATLVAFFQIAAVSQAADEAERGLRDLERSMNSINFDF
jgi:amino acid transporter